MGSTAEKSYRQFDTYIDQNQLSFFAEKLQLWRKELCSAATAPVDQEDFAVIEPDWVDEAAT